MMHHLRANVGIFLARPEMNFQSSTRYFKMVSLHLRTAPVKSPWRNVCFRIHQNFSCGSQSCNVVSSDYVSSHAGINTGSKKSNMIIFSADQSVLAVLIFDPAVMMFRISAASLSILLHTSPDKFDTLFVSTLSEVCPGCSQTYHNVARICLFFLAYCTQHVGLTFTLWCSVLLLDSGCSDPDTLENAELRLFLRVNLQRNWSPRYSHIHALQSIALQHMISHLLLRRSLQRSQLSPTCIAMHRQFKLSAGGRIGYKCRRHSPRVFAMPQCLVHACWIHWWNCSPVSNAAEMSVSFRCLGAFCNRYSSRFLW